MKKLDGFWMQGNVQDCGGDLSINFNDDTDFSMTLKSGDSSDTVASKLRLLANEITGNFDGKNGNGYQPVNNENKPSPPPKNE